MSRRASRNEEPPVFAQPPEDDAQLTPFSEELERAMLGSMLLFPQVFHGAASTVVLDDFFCRHHRLIFAAISRSAHEGKTIDTMNIAEELGREGALGNVGGVVYLSSLTDVAARHESIVSEYATRLREYSQRRRLLSAFDSAKAKTFDKQNTVLDIIADIEQAVTDVVSDDDDKEVSLDTTAQEVWESICAQRDDERDIVGLPSSIKEFDETTTGFRNGEYFIVAGWPGSGKTAFALQVLLENAMQLTNVGVFSAEMSRHELALRAVSQMTGVEFMRVRSPKYLFNNQVEKIAQGLSDFKKLPLQIDDSGSLEVNKLIARSRRMVARGAKLIVYDYIQKFTVKGERDPRLVTNVVSERLREFAKSAKIPIIVLSQLKRPSDGVVRRPRLFDLKETGNLEQDAHCVTLLFRPTDKKDESTGRDALIIAKQRSGPLGDIPVKFIGEVMRYEYREPKKEDEETKSEEVAEKKSSTKKAKAKVEERNVTGERPDDDAALFATEPT